MTMRYVVERPQRHSSRPPGNVAHRSTEPDGGESMCGAIVGGIPTDDEHAAALTPCPTCEGMVP